MSTKGFLVLLLAIQRTAQECLPGIYLDSYEDCFEASDSSSYFDHTTTLKPNIQVFFNASICL